MAKSIADITKNYTQFSQMMRQYMNRQAAQEYNAEQFQWFRPASVTDTTDLAQISSPFATDELDELATSLVRDGDVSQGSSGDYAMLMLQHDAIVSANRAFASRHRSKLRHFAHADGVFDRLGNEYGTVHYSCDMILTNLKRQASQG